MSTETETISTYVDNTGRDDLLSGGVKRIPIDTPSGTFTVWTKRFGNNPTIKVLLLHGGPGSTHEYLEACDSYFPAAGYVLRPTRLLLQRPAGRTGVVGGVWPDSVNRSFKHINPAIYIPMQGPSELGASGTLLHWGRTADLARIETPTLVIGAQHDTMDPEHLRWMAGAVKNGRYLHCPNGSHLAMYDDQATYFEGLITFTKDVDG